MQPAGLRLAVQAVDPDVVDVAASAGGAMGDARAFSDDRNAVLALISAFGGRGKSPIFASGSAVFGIFAGGERADPMFTEGTHLPLLRAAYAPPSAEVTDAFADDLGQAIGARVEAEQAVLRAEGVRGMVVRPGNIYGYGGSVDIPKLIEIARANGVAPHWGSGGTTHGCVHLDDVVELYRLAIAYGRRGAAYHAVAEEISQRNLGGAVSRMIGAGDRTDSVTLERMHELGGTRGLRLSINKRLSADRTRAELGWSPVRMNALEDVEFRSYADRGEERS